MSNFRAVATVSASLQAIVADAVASISGARVVTRRPQKDEPDSSAPRVDIFLYQVLLHSAFRSTDAREQVAIDLHYLLSFSGDEQRYEPELLLGSAVRGLHDEPVLRRERILQVEAGAREQGGSRALGSDLSMQEELVRIAPIPLSLEDLTKIWSTFFQAPYSVSVAYEVGVVLIDREVVRAGTI